MKRIITFLLIMAFSLGTVSVYGADDNLENMILMVKSRMDLPEEFKDFNYNVNDVTYGTIYNFEWGSKNKSIMVTAVNDIILNYMVYNSKEDYKYKPSVQGIKKDEALNTIKDFVKKINPTIYDKLKIEIIETTSITDKTYKFSVNRTENGIPYTRDMGKGAINRFTGEVENFSLNWSTKGQFASNENIITKEQAMLKFKEKIGMKPQYRFDNDEKSSIVYIPKNGKDIDGLTGELSKDVIYEYSNDNSFDKEEGSGGSGGGDLNESKPTATLSPEEQVAVSKNKNLLTKEKAFEIIKNDKYIGYNDGYELSSANLYMVDKEKDTYNWQFSIRKKEKYEYINVVLNAKNGEILSFSNYNNSEKEGTATKDNAKDVINYYMKDKANIYMYTEENNYQASPYYSKKNDKSFNFVRYYKEIEVASDYATIVYNKDGSVAAFNYTYTDATMVEPDIISEDKAMEEMFKQFEYSLIYKPHNLKEQTTQLVYSLNEFPVIDGKTGQKISDSKKEIYKGYKDIENHWAKNYIETLASFGIFLSGEEVAPDKLMTKGDFYSLLGKILGFDNTEDIFYFKYLGIGIDENIDINAPLRRIDAVEALITMDGGKDYANLEGIYKTPFNDVDEKIGFVALAYAKGLVNGYNNQFKPNDVLTRAEGITMIYNYCN